MTLGPARSTVAYFSMEIALEQAIPTYSGGLGVLAGDTLRSAADLGVPLVAVTLLHRKGYFIQHLDASGHQTESPVPWYLVSDFVAYCDCFPANGVVTFQPSSPRMQWPAVSTTRGAITEPEHAALSWPPEYMSINADSG